MKATFDALIREIVVSMATESRKKLKFLDFCYNGNKIERFFLSIQKAKKKKSYSNLSEILGSLKSFGFLFLIFGESPRGLD